MKHIVGPLARFLFVLFVLLALVPAQCSQKRLKKKLSKKGDLDAELAMGYSWRNHKLYAKQDGNIEWMVGNGQKVGKRDHLVTLTWSRLRTSGGDAEGNFEEKVYAPVSGSVRVRYESTASQATKYRLILEIE